MIKINSIILIHLLILLFFMNSSLAQDTNETKIKLVNYKTPLCGAIMKEISNEVSRQTYEKILCDRRVRNETISIELTNCNFNDALLKINEKLNLIRRHSIRKEGNVYVIGLYKHFIVGSFTNSEVHELKYPIGDKIKDKLINKFKKDFYIDVRVSPEKYEIYIILKNSYEFSQHYQKVLKFIIDNDNLN